MSNRSVENEIGAGLRREQTYDIVDIEVLISRVIGAALVPDRQRYDEVAKATRKYERLTADSISLRG